LEGFLDGLRQIADETGAILIFDEVITGFRLGAAGAQDRYDVNADLVMLGKVLGGGLPVAAVGGRAELMDHLAPEGPVYQAGTLAGNPLATAAGASVLRRLREPRAYAELELRGELLENGLREAAADDAVCVQRVGPMLTLFMRTGPVRDFTDAAESDTHRYGALFRHLLREGVYVPPSQFEAMFVSLAHGEAEIDATITAVARFFQRGRGSREPELG
jgi:glutamate-1-semialdehyde 2,1-aminomutase